MKFEWDQRKNEANYAKHGISFELASKVFDDPLVTYIFDRTVDEEELWHAIGKVQNLPVLVIVHTYRGEEEEIVRIISARQASSHERRRYEQE
jgi:uncharacterized DUF497 family protein